MSKSSTDRSYLIICFKPILCMYLDGKRGTGWNPHKGRREACHMRALRRPAFSQPLPVKGFVHNCSGSIFEIARHGCAMDLGYFWAQIKFLSLRFWLVWFKLLLTHLTWVQLEVVVCTWISTISFYCPCFFPASLYEIILRDLDESDVVCDWNLHPGSLLSFPLLFSHVSI